MNLEEIKSNKVGMILRFSIPSIIAMVLTSCITIADGYFIGNYVGSEGVAAVNLGLPIVYLYLALGFMLSVGGMAIAGMKLGAGELRKCNNVFNQTMFVTTVVSFAISIVVFLLFEPMLHVLHADGLVAVHFRTYYRVLLFELPIMVINSSFGMFIRGEGNPAFFMKVNIINVVLNIVLDYLFAKWFHWGVFGIAIASLISAVVELAFIILFILKGSKVYHFSTFAFDKKVLMESLGNGSSEFIGELSMCISMFAYNYVIMRKVGVDGVTAFTIVGYASYFFSMIIVGFGQGASPLISFTFGAVEHKLAQSLRKITNLMVFAAGVVMLVIMLAGAGWYSNLFVKDTQINEMIHSGIRIFVISFLFSGINSITSFYFTSIGKALESAVISGARGLVILLIGIFTLPVLFGMTGVWLVAPCTEAITLIISFIYILIDEKRVQIAKQQPVKC